MKFDNNVNLFTPKSIEIPPHTLNAIRERFFGRLGEIKVVEYKLFLTKDLFFKLLKFAKFKFGAPDKHNFFRNVDESVQETRKKYLLHRRSDLFLKTKLITRSQILI